MSIENQPTIAFDFRVSARVLVGEEHVTEDALDDLEERLLRQIAERLGRNVISTDKVVFEIVKTEKV